MHCMKQLGYRDIRLTGMVTPSDTMAASSKLEIRQRVDLSRYFMVGRCLPGSHFRFYLKHIFLDFCCAGR